MKTTYYGHSCFAVQIKNRTLLFDPFITPNELAKSIDVNKVPADYIRKQTIANGERFITPELKEMEGKILGAEERSLKLEYELFQKLRERVLAACG